MPPFRATVDTQGYSRGQADVIRIMNAEGLVVYDGPFDPASYVEETFQDKKHWRHTGVALVVAGAVLNLVWPEGSRRGVRLFFVERFHQYS